jgi:hypothetical protein
MSNDVVFTVADGVEIDLFAGQQDVAIRTPDGWKLRQRRMVPWPPQGAR